MCAPLGRWVYLLVHGERLDTDPLSASLETPEVHRAPEELEMPWTKEQLERHMHESHLKAVRDDIARQEGAFQKGFESLGRCQARCRHSDPACPANRSGSRSGV